MRILSLSSIIIFVFLIVGTIIDKMFSMENFMGRIKKIKIFSKKENSSTSKLVNKLLVDSDANLTKDCLTATAKENGKFASITSTYPFLTALSTKKVQYYEIKVKNVENGAIKFGLFDQGQSFLYTNQGKLEICGKEKEQEFGKTFNKAGIRVGCGIYTKEADAEHHEAPKVYAFFTHNGNIIEKLIAIDGNHHQALHPKIYLFNKETKVEANFKIETKKIEKDLEKILENGNKVVYNFDEETEQAAVIEEKNEEKK